MTFSGILHGVTAIAALIAASPIVAGFFRRRALHLEATAHRFSTAPDRAMLRIVLPADAEGEQVQVVRPAQAAIAPGAAFETPDGMGGFDFDPAQTPPEVFSGTADFGARADFVVSLPSAETDAITLRVSARRAASSALFQRQRPSRKITVAIT